MITNYTAVKKKEPGTLQPQYTDINYYYERINIKPSDTCTCLSFKCHRRNDKMEGWEIS